MSLAATTKLEAVNSMLSAIGESPVDSLTGTLPIDATMAINQLDEVSRAVQTRGWHFNTDTKVTLTPDGSDNILIPTGALSVDIDVDLTQDVVIRDDKLYNKNTNSYEFTSSIEATVTYGLDFEDIPEYARQYIMKRAARVFAARAVGSDKLNNFLGQEEFQALAQFKRNENRVADYSIFNAWDSFKIINRRAPLDRIQ
jgi:hypothetical protein